MKKDVTVDDLIDMALGSPEIGTVNFNVLQRLLHELVTRMKCGGDIISISADEKDIKQVVTTSDKAGDKATAILPPNYAALMKRVEIVESKIDKLDSDYPGADEIMAAKKTRSEQPQGSGSVSDMWKFIQLQKRCDANETGMSKMSELIESLMDKIVRLEDEKDGLAAKLVEFRQKESGELSHYASTYQPVDLPTIIFERPFEIERSFKHFENTIASTAPSNFPISLGDNLVTYQEPHSNLPEQQEAASIPSNEQLARIEERLRNLEKSGGRYATMDDLNGVRQQSQQAWQNVQQRIQQTNEQVNKLEADIKALMDRDSDRDELNAQAMAKLDEYSLAIAKLTERSNELEKKILELQEEMLRKADRTDIQNLHLSDSLLASVDALRQQLENLTSLRERDADAVRQLRDSLDDAQDEVDRLRKVSNSLVTDVASHGSSITTLLADTVRLQEDKADRLWVADELLRKADRPDLDRKANAAEIQQLIRDLSKLIEENQQRCELLEEEAKRARLKLDAEFSRKADKSDVDTLREYFESKMKSIMSRLGKLGAQQAAPELNAEDAAAFKVVKSHCLSCDRPIEMRPFSPPPAIPGPGQGMAPNRTPRPFTTYELEQIRQATKRPQNTTSVLPPTSSRTGQVPVENIEGIAAQPLPKEENPYIGNANRPVGGSHTMTYPHHRVTRITHLSAVVPEDILLYDLAQDEREIQGADGRMYRARYSDRLPAVSQRQAPQGGGPIMRAYVGSPKGNMVPPLENGVLRHSAQRDSGIARPGSARAVSAGSSSSRRLRPTSASQNSMLSQHRQFQQQEIISQGNQLLLDESKQMVPDRIEPVTNGLMDGNMHVLETSGRMSVTVSEISPQPGPTPASAQSNVPFAGDGRPSSPAEYPPASGDEIEPSGPISEFIQVDSAPSEPTGPITAFIQPGSAPSEPTGPVTESIPPDSSPSDPTAESAEATREAMVYEEEEYP